MSNYSFYCKKCGYTHLSDDKAEVQAARIIHKTRRQIGGITGCRFTHTGYGTIARANLVPTLIINN